MFGAFRVAPRVPLRVIIVSIETPRRSTRRRASPFARRLRARSAARRDRRRARRERRERARVSAHEGHAALRERALRLRRRVARSTGAARGKRRRPRRRRPVALGVSQPRLARDGPPRPFARAGKREARRLARRTQTGTRAETRAPRCGRTVRRRRDEARRRCFFVRRAGRERVSGRRDARDDVRFERRLLSKRAGER